MNIVDDIYVVLPIGAKPLFPIASSDPGYTASTDALGRALTKHHGYTETSRGKGSHVKLTKPAAPTIVLPGNRKVVSPGVTKQVLIARWLSPFAAARSSPRATCLINSCLPNVPAAMGEDVSQHVGAALN